MNNEDAAEPASDADKLVYAAIAANYWASLLPKPKVLPPEMMRSIAENAWSMYDTD